MTVIDEMPSLTKTKLDRPLRMPPHTELETVDLPEDLKKQLTEKYGFYTTEYGMYGIRWIPNEKRLWVPIMRLSGAQIGGVKRSLDPKVKPKSITHLWGAEHPLAAFYRCRSISKIKKALWIVEDQFSAIKAARNADAVALLGTNLSDTVIYEIIKADYADITVALDKDAKLKALQMVKELTGVFNSVRFEPLDKDIKDMSAFEIYEIMRAAS